MVKRAGYLARTNNQAKRVFVERTLPYIRKVLRDASTQFGPLMVNTAVGNALSVASRLSYNGTQTNVLGSKTKQKYRSTNGSGLLAGKLYPRRRARTYRRKGRRRMRRVVKAQSSGSSYQSEHSGTVTADKTLYVAHTTCVPDIMLLTFCMECVKRVLQVHGVTISSWDRDLLGYVKVGDVFQIIYKVAPNSSPTGVLASYSVASVGAGQNFFTIASGLYTVVRANMAAGSFNDAVILVEVQYTPLNGTVQKVDLQDGKITFYSKSALKVQNRSVALAADNEADDVNNVPIYGKLYHGIGNGALQRSIDNIKFVNGPALANNVALAGDAYSNFSEPPDASEFTHVTKFMKAYFNPGQIKTSVLSFKTNINVSLFFNTMIQYYTGNSTEQYLKIGLFRMFSLERVIAKLAGEDTPAMKIAYEIDFKIWGTLRPHKQTYTTPYRQN